MKEATPSIHVIILDIHRVLIPSVIQLVNDFLVGFLEDVVAIQTLAYVRFDYLQ